MLSFGPWYGDFFKILPVFHALPMVFDYKHSDQASLASPLTIPFFQSRDPSRIRIALC